MRVQRPRTETAQAVALSLPALALGRLPRERMSDLSLEQTGAAQRYAEPELRAGLGQAPRQRAGLALRRELLACPVRLLSPAAELVSRATPALRLLLAEIVGTTKCRVVPAPQSASRRAPGTA